MTLLTLTPKNAVHVREAGRGAATESRSAIGAWVAAEVERMAGQLDRTTAFYIQLRRSRA